MMAGKIFGWVSVALWVLLVVGAICVTATLANATERRHVVHHHYRHHVVRHHVRHVVHRHVHRRIVVAAPSVFFSGGLVEQARAYLGETAAQVGVRRSLWCAAFMNKLLNGGTHSDLAASYAHYGRPASAGCVGCIAVTSRRGGGHVGVVTGWQGNNPVIVSGNHGRRVGEGVYPRTRVVSLRWP